MTKVFWCKNCLNMSTRPRIDLIIEDFVMRVIGLRKKKLIGQKELRFLKN